MPDPSDAAVHRWHAQLDSRIGLDDVEIKQLNDDLLSFCERHATRPDLLLATWRDYPQLTVRRAPTARLRPELAVESFLIHNGINVFGDIVCVAGRPEDLADQGEQFLPGTR